MHMIIYNFILNYFYPPIVEIKNKSCHWMTPHPLEIPPTRKKKWNIPYLS